MNGHVTTLVAELSETRGSGGVGRDTISFARGRESSRLGNVLLKEKNKTRGTRVVTKRVKGRRCFGSCCLAKKNACMKLSEWLPKGGQTLALVIKWMSRVQSHVNASVRALRDAQVR